MSQTICNNCGFSIPGGATFCPECGTAISGAIAATLQQPAGAISTAAASFEAIQQSKFFHFFGNFINLMDQSSFLRKPLLWLYMFFAALNILVPVYLLFQVISKDLLNNVGFGALVLWLIFALAGWMGFQLWWKRKDQIGRYYAQGDEFYAIPLFSHYIQTTGEWLGTTIAIVGSGGALVAWLFLKDSRMGSAFPIPLENFGVAAVFVAPIIGFIIILFTKVLAELYRALAAIANNTKAISVKK